MRRKRKLIAALALALMIVLTQLAWIPTVSAKDLTNDPDLPNFIDSVSLTYRDGSPLGADVPKDADILLTYTYSIPNDATVLDGDTFSLPIPNEILVLGGPNFFLKDTDDPMKPENIAEVSYDGHGLLVTFTSYAGTYSNVVGDFELELSFDPGGIGNDDSTNINFPVGGTTGTETITVTFDQPDTTVEKRGEYDPATRQITWTLTINPEEVSMTDPVLTDLIPVGQEYVPGSATISGGTESHADGFSFDGTNIPPDTGEPPAHNGYTGELTYTFGTMQGDPASFAAGGTFNEEYTIEFKTDVLDVAFVDDGTGDFYDDDDTFALGNQAGMTLNGTSLVSNAATVDIDVDHINKLGEHFFSAAAEHGDHLAGAKQINWTIEVNNNDLTIINPIVTDTIPAGLTYIADSFRLLDSSGTVVETDAPAGLDVTGQNLTYTFADDGRATINDNYTILFSTSVEASAYESNADPSYDNTANLTGSLIPADTGDNANVSVPSELLRKRGTGYNDTTAEISWEIRINYNDISLTDVVITDQIPTGQEYVPGSAQITTTDGVYALADGFSFDDTDIPPDTAEPPAHNGFTGTLTYTFGTMSTDPVPVFLPGDDDQINRDYTITFRTRLTDPDDFASNTVNKRFYNTASMTNDEGFNVTSTGNRNITSTVLEKRNVSYNYQTRRFVWEVDVNQNEMPLDGVVITDTIGENHELVSSTLSIENLTTPASPAVGAFSGITTTGWVYSFAGQITEEYRITYETEIPDSALDVFNTNGTKQFRNDVGFDSDYTYDVPVTTFTTRGVRNEVIGKTGTYQTGNTYIDWTVWVNMNDIELNEAVIEDQLQEGLALDTETVQLFHATANAATGDLEKQGGAIELTGDNVSYDMNTRLFLFTLPESIMPFTGGYILEFRTDVTDRDQSPFSNQASFNGSGSLQTGDSGAITVSWQGAGSSGRGEVGSMEILKVDAEDGDHHLDGAEFQLIDRYGNPIAKQTTSGGGTTLFENLRFDVDYTINELTPPTGFVASDPYVFQIDGEAASKDIQYTWENERVYGHITAKKVDDHGDPVEGATLTLYDDTSAVVMAVATNADGTVLYEDIGYGDYTIEETVTPDGYFTSADVLSASVVNDGETVDAGVITNARVRADVKATKVDEDEVAPLAGAELSLFAVDDTAFADPVDTQVSAADGTVKFVDIGYGDYVLKETAAPEGYVVSDETIAVQVRAHGVDVNAGNYANRRIRGVVRVQIRNIRGEPLEKATFTLYNKDGKPVGVGESDDEGFVEFPDVPYGDYTVRMTIPPDDYLPSDDILVADIIVDGETVDVIADAERDPAVPWPQVENPNTGGGATDVIWTICLAALLLIAVAAAPAMMRRHR